MTNEVGLQEFPSATLTDEQIFDVLRPHFLQFDLLSYGLKRDLLTAARAVIAKVQPKPQALDKLAALAEAISYAENEERIDGNVTLALDWIDLLTEAARERLAQLRVGDADADACIALARRISNEGWHSSVYSTKEGLVEILDEHKRDADAAVAMLAARPQCPPLMTRISSTYAAPKPDGGE